MKVRSHQGHGNYVLHHRQLDLFQFLKDVSPLIQEASSVLTNWSGVAGLEILCRSVLTEPLRNKQGQLKPFWCLGKNRI